MKATDYKAIVAWGRLMNSFASYVRDQQDKAAEDGAPVDAIYKFYHRKEGWHRLSEVDNPSTIDWFSVQEPELYYKFLAGKGKGPDK